MLARSNNHSPPLVIALVNNMAPAAKRPTEEQFTRLLTSASQTLNVRFTLFAIENLPAQSDDILDLLQKAQADGLIVTGAEPRHAAMTDEPSWPAFAKLVDWASDNTISSVWSCMAAHAAAFRLDQIHRKPLPQKLSGVFTCTKSATGHPLLRDAPSKWPVPHSRSNSLDEAELRRKGYTILSHASRVGVDSFAKQIRTSLFLLLQGHPEYGSDSLLNEYRRDVRRFLAGQRNRYPDTPEGYFSQDTTSALARLREQASRRPSLDLLASVDAAIIVAPRPAWHPAAALLYTNWLAYVAEQKANREQAATRAPRQWRIAS
jgi:homoserine O-succinyltransferase/O-acetyltransferase